MRIKDYKDKIGARMITSFDDMIGKTVREVSTYDYSNVLFAFDDGTFIAVTQEYEWEDSYLVPNEQIDNIDLGALNEIGILSADEVKDFRALKKKSIEDAYNARQRHEYERLRAQFEKMEG